MRVLVVLSHVPLPEGSAAGRCSVGLLRGLRGHGLEVKAIAATWGGPDNPPPPDDLDVEVIPVEGPTGWRGRLRRYRDPQSTLGHGRFAQRVGELAEDVDLVHLDEVLGAPAARATDAPALVHIHCLSRLDRRLGKPWSSQTRDFVELARAEDRVSRTAPWILANSQEVAAGLRRRGAHEVEIAPLALDPNDYQPAASTEPPVAGLIGSAVWPPTANAVRTLVRDVWPTVLSRAPEAKLRIAGWGMTREFFSDLPERRGVEWVGSVESGKEFLRSVGMLLYPLERGSGTKVKTLEAMALGLPVVTTARGAEGLAASPGIIVADDVQGLADNTVGLLLDGDARARVGLHAREAFMKDHTPAVATARIIDVYRRMLDPESVPRV